MSRKGYIIFLLNFSTTADAEMATELHLTSPVRSFCVRASTVRDRNGWLDALNTAIEDHNSRKATFFNNDQRIECKMGKLRFQIYCINISAQVIFIQIDYFFFEINQNLIIIDLRILYIKCISKNLVQKLSIMKWQICHILV